MGWKNQRYVDQLLFPFKESHAIINVGSSRAGSETPNSNLSRKRATLERKKKKSHTRSLARSERRGIFHHVRDGDEREIKHTIVDQTRLAQARA